MGAAFSTSTFTPDNLVVSLANAVSRKVTLASGQNCVRGTVLGKVTASSKYTLALSASTDGSQTPDVILAEDCDASSADAEALCYFRGQFNAAAITLGTGLTVADITEGLRLKGIDLIAAGA